MGTSNGDVQRIPYRAGGEALAPHTLVVAGLCALGVLVGGLLAIGAGTSVYVFPELLWSVAGLGVVWAVVIVRTWRGGNPGPFHPLVYAGWVFFIPAFFIGGLYVAVADYRPEWWGLIPDPSYHLPLTILYVAMGVAAMHVGFSLPVGRAAGLALSGRLPDLRWNPRRAVAASVAMLAVGEAFRIVALMMGLGGYQIREDPSSFGFTVVAFSWLSSIASFVIWYTIVRHAAELPWRTLAGTLVAYELAISFVSGHRSTLVFAGVRVFAACWLAGWRMNLRRAVLTTCILAALLFGGYAIGTTYRSIKGSEGRVSLEESLTLGRETYSALVDDGAFGDVAGLDSVLRRFESVTSLAVVVASYERLRPVEEQYGIRNNIVTDTLTAVVPRFVWPDKPLVSDARSYSALYFGRPSNSFALTVVGDLLRNFGAIGVAIGMMLIGVALRGLWCAFGSGTPRNAWEAASYYFLLTRFGYEGFFGSILPNIVRMVVILVLYGAVVGLFAREGRPRVYATHSSV